MTLKQRLLRLEKQVPAPQDLLPWIVVVNDNGLIVDDGSAAVSRCIGKPPSSLPVFVQVIRGIDPRLVVGPMPEPSAGPFEAMQ
ncbi:MAG: hypothetical protein U0744_03225 [Gemmataceae bacterium]